MLPDRELRRMVVDLAALRGEDIAAVLEKLSPQQRRKVEGLLKEFSEFGFASTGALLSERSVVIDVTRVSSWLVERTDPERSGANMTPSTRAALLQCATDLYPAPQAPSRARGPSMFGRLKSLFWTGAPA